eukprot:TRINITY_DN39300_c0_g1_i2.p1 TRINITY_DN39300_c0_g1~~TRINITY_DN39300_c0_g1_i2.p1  ORF type:complete len:143 (+),score=17.56 TRINITY_DN39300_c0_g1_i2:67-495(+)
MQFVAIASLACRRAVAKAPPSTQWLAAAYNCFARRLSVTRQLRSSSSGTEEERAAPRAPALPTPSSSSLDSERQRILEVGGEKLQLDALGPVLIHEDGTLGRVSNWHEMTEHERELTMKVIAKRNKSRRETFLRRQKADAGH